MTKTANDYQDLICEIEPRSAFLTPLAADTLWGSLVWACRWVYGEAALSRLLEAQSDGSPALLVSDAMPDGWLPRPQQPVPVAAIRQTVTARGYVEGSPAYFEALAAAKEWLQQPYLKRRDVYSLLAGRQSQSQLMARDLSAFVQRRAEHKKLESAVATAPRRHNVIDRQRGTSLEENGLYLQSEAWLQNRWCIYLRTTCDIDWLKPLFTYVSETGFGKRASTGLGHFTVRRLRPLATHEQFPAVADANGFLTLSSAYVPHNNEVSGQAYYSLHLKRGKLGAAMATTEKGGYLKRPVTMCNAGSVFATDAPPRKWYGSLLDDMHKELAEVKQYGYAFPLAGKLF